MTLSSARTAQSATQAPAEERNQLLTVTVRAYGPQEVAVHAAINGGPADLAYVAVTVGHTLTYCYDLPAVTCHATAWAQACAQPARWLPETTAGFTDPQGDGNRVAVQLSTTGAQPSKVLGVSPVASRDGQPHLMVRVGRVTSVVFDRAALGSYRAAWTEALSQARRVFTDPDPDAFDVLERQAREREASHFERTGTVTGQP
jgi:ABC-type amino acid transport substrate-binding protein